MKVEILYPHIIAASDSESKGPEFFASYHKRFAESFEKFKPGFPHTLRVIICGPNANFGDYEKVAPLYPSLYPTFTYYRGAGWDIGSYWEIARDFENCDLVVCVITQTHFRESGWLVPIAEAFQKYGDGLYGTSASYQHVPHIRCGCFAFSPSMMRQYPWMVNSREDGFLFESGVAPRRVDLGRSFTNWMLAQGKPVKLVTRDACYDLPDWRKPANIFRRGDQSNALAWDRHFDIYAAADPAEKNVLEKLADG